jgi:hypothetical protein
LTDAPGEAKLPRVQWTSTGSCYDSEAELQAFESDIFRIEAEQRIGNVMLARRGLRFLNRIQAFVNERAPWAVITHDLISKPTGRVNQSVICSDMEILTVISLA